MCSSDLAKSFRNVNITIKTNLSSSAHKEAWNNFYQRSTSSDRRSFSKELANISTFVADFFNMDEDKISVLMYNNSNDLLATYDDDGLTIKSW